MQILGFLIKPPSGEGFEQDRKAKFLHSVLWIALISGIFLGFHNIDSGAPQVAIAFFALSAFSLFGLYINGIKKYLWAATIVTALIIFVEFFNMYDGMSLYDPGIVALPITIIFTGFIFGKRSIFPVTIVNLFGVLGLVYLERSGAISPPRTSSNERVLIISTLLIISAFLLRAIMDNLILSLSIARTSQADLQKAYDLTLEGWAKTLEFRDRETEGHSRRVTELAIELAKKLGLNKKEEIDQIHRGALLHDIGKISIPDSILNKPSSLTPEEYTIVKQHTSYAYELLKEIPYLQSPLDIPCFHHENWDGQGYPKGLKGEEIPLPARLFAVVDNWDALSSNRPYRKAWADNKVIAYIKEQSGRKFDPQIVEVFIEMVS